MGIKISEQEKIDLLRLEHFLQERDEVWVNNHQEQILTVLYMMLSDDFRNNIGILRKQYKIPKRWYTTENLTDKDYEDWEEWVLVTKPLPPRTAYDEDIYSLCQKIGIDPLEYGEFVVGYLYFRKINITTIMGFNIKADDEYKYKAKLETDHGLGIYDIPAFTPHKGYIRFYKDTTPNQLIRFIKNNWQNIQAIQKHLPLYPHSKKHKKFKRDILIYINHLFGSKAPDIADKLASIGEKDGYSVDDVETRQIISLLERKINKTFFKPKSVNKTR